MSVSAMRRALLCVLALIVWSGSCAAALPPATGIPASEFRPSPILEGTPEGALLGLAETMEQMVAESAFRLFQRGLRELIEQAGRRTAEMFARLDEDRRRRILQLDSQDLPLDEQVRLLKARLRAAAEKSP